MSDQGSSKRESVIARSLTLTPHKSNPLQDKTNKKKELDEGRYAPRDFYIPTTGALGWVCLNSGSEVQWNENVR